MQNELFNKSDSNENAVTLLEWVEEHHNEEDSTIVGSSTGCTGCCCGSQR